MTDYVALSYALVILFLVLVALYALAYPTLIAPRFFKADVDALKDVASFITARSTQSRWRIAFSFYAGSVGAWAITTPANYASFAGWVGMVAYAAACGLPILVLGLYGHKVKEMYPTAGSLGEVMTLRYGPVMKGCAVVVALFNMAIFMLAEFTTIGALFQDFVGTKNYPIIIVMAILTTAYSCYGGLLVSIVTDQIQAGVSLLFLLVLSIYVWANFDQPLVEGFGELKPLLGVNDAGLGAIYVMPASLMAATLFNEGMWQRVWAAEDRRALQHGAIGGCCAVIVAIFLYGLFGFIACWGGLVDYATTNVNLYLFQVFKTSPEQPANSVVDSGIEVLTLILALVMSESAIDSLQNGISATISSTFLRGKPLIYARVVVLLINIIIIPFALANYNVLSLFLSANMLGCCWFLPVLAGGFWDTPTGRRVYSETTVVLGSCATILLVTIYGIVDGPRQCASLANAGVLWEPYHDVCQCASAAQLGELPLEVTGKVNCGAAGAHWTWVGQPYMWEYFLFVSGVSFGLVTLFGLINLFVLPDTLPGLTDVLGLSHLRDVKPVQLDVAQTKDTMMPVMAPAGAPPMGVVGYPQFAPGFMPHPYGQQFAPQYGGMPYGAPPMGMGMGMGMPPPMFGNNNMMMQPQYGQFQSGMA